MLGTRLGGIQRRNDIREPRNVIGQWSKSGNRCSGKGKKEPSLRELVRFGDWFTTQKEGSTTMLPSLRTDCSKYFLDIHSVLIATL